jgi:hypothetical protein
VRITCIRIAEHASHVVIDEKAIGEHPKHATTMCTMRLETAMQDIKRRVLRGESRFSSFYSLLGWRGLKPLHSKQSAPFNSNQGDSRSTLTACSYVFLFLPRVPQQVGIIVNLSSGRHQFSQVENMNQCSWYRFD